MLMADDIQSCWLKYQPISNNPLLPLHNTHKSKNFYNKTVDARAQDPSQVASQIYLARCKNTQDEFWFCNSSYQQLPVNLS